MCFAKQQKSRAIHPNNNTLYFIPDIKEVLIIAELCCVILQMCRKMPACSIRTQLCLTDVTHATHADCAVCDMSCYSSDFINLLFSSLVQ